MRDRLLLHERAVAEGSERTWLATEDGHLFVEVEGGARTELPVAVLDVVMRRYGKPLAEDIALEGTRLVVEGRTIAMLRYRPLYDVIAKDYVVYVAPGEPPVAELATAVTAALSYLLRREVSMNATE